MYVFSSAFFFNKLIYYIYQLSHIIDRHDNIEKAFFPLSLAVTYIESKIINNWACTPHTIILFCCKQQHCKSFL